MKFAHNTTLYLNTKPPKGYKKFLIHYRYKDAATGNGDTLEDYIKINCKKRPNYKDAKAFAQRKISNNIDENFKKRKITAVISVCDILL